MRYAGIVCDFVAKNAQYSLKFASYMVCLVPSTGIPLQKFLTDIVWITLQHFQTNITGQSLKYVQLTVYDSSGCIDFRRSQNKMLIFQKAIQQSENKELITQNELANVIKIVSCVYILLILNVPYLNFSTVSISYIPIKIA